MVIFHSKLLVHQRVYVQHMYHHDLKPSAFFSSLLSNKNYVTLMYLNGVNLITHVFFVGADFQFFFLSAQNEAYLMSLQWALPQDMSMKDLILCLLEADNRKVFLVQDWLNCDGYISYMFECCWILFTPFLFVFLTIYVYTYVYIYMYIYIYVYIYMIYIYMYIYIYMIYIYICLSCILYMEVS